MTAAPPQVTKPIIEALLDTHATALRDRRLVLVHGRYAPGAPKEFARDIAGERRRIRVTDEDSVLGIMAAWHRHLDDTREGGDVLVVTTGVDQTQLGWDLRGHAVRRRTLPVERAEIVKQRFGATALDPRLYREPWLLQALLDAEPHDGWPRSGAVLTFDTALRTLVVARLGLGRPEAGSSPGGPSAPDVALDVDTLLAWSRTTAGPARFAELADSERRELGKWLGETSGAAARVLLALVETGRGSDAMPLGLLGSVLADPAASPDQVLAVGGLFGQVTPRGSDIKAFTEAVEGTLIRWIGEARTDDDSRRDLFAVLDRADALAASAGLTDGLHTNRFLPSSFTTQLRGVAAALMTSAADAETALADLRSHQLARLSQERVAAAEMGVRVARWLAAPPSTVPSVPTGVRAHLAEWGWVDRALNVLWAGDRDGDPAVGQAYRALFDAARARRDALDEEFAGRLAGWTRTANAQHPGGALLVENVLTEAAVPLLGKQAPLILLLDGMSSAVAAQFGEELERLGWSEVVPRPAEGRPAQRLAAVSMIPSVTRISRASLLTGGPTSGGQSAEATGFAAYWKKQDGDRGGVLFHKAAISGDAGRRLSEELTEAIASDTVVGCVLNTIDDALDHGQQGERTQWRLADVSFLRELLDAARSYDRPVLLVADHGHVLERGAGDGPASLPGAESSRWRTGTPDDGEIELSGPRVLEGGGTVVAPWREDIRYTPRKAGYHGGAALAEVTVPLLVLTPSRDAVPKGWQLLPRERATPVWWRPSPVSEPETAVPAQTPPAPIASKGGRKRAADRPSGEGLFDEADVTTPGAPEASAPTVSSAVPTTLGARVVAGQVYEAQKVYVRKAPEAKVVAAVLDALEAAGGTLSPAAVAAAAATTGRAPRNTDGFISTLQRLLNVEGYPVLGFIDSGHTVKLDVPLLRTQFHLQEAAS